MRTPQLRAPFVPERPSLGYYNDLRPHLARYVRDPLSASQDVARLTANRDNVNPTTIVQIGLGAWQAAKLDARWMDCIRVVVDWALAELDADGSIPYRFAMRHTYRLLPPWTSAMVQGEAASLLVRAAETLDEPDLAIAADRAAAPLLDARSPLVVRTNEGPVLEEYPTTPPSHVLNGWIFALWGLYDVAHGMTRNGAAGEEFRRGAETLARRLPLYTVGGSWSRYDLYPHPLPNLASPFYHRLHIEQLAVLARLAPHDAFAETAARWETGAARLTTRAAAVAAKVAFRVVRPRRGAFKNV